jgi:hypothetical protein
MDALSLFASRRWRGRFCLMPGCEARRAHREGIRCNAGLSEPPKFGSFYFETSYFADDQKLIWEYPRAAPLLLPCRSERRNRILSTNCSYVIEGLQAVRRESCGHGRRCREELQILSDGLFWLLNSSAVQNRAGRFDRAVIGPSLF